MPHPLSFVDRRDPVLVWGGLGFLGQHLVARLLQDGVDVSVLCRSRAQHQAPLWSSRVKWFELDHPAAGDATLRAAVASASIIYNFAGSSGAAASNRDPLHSLEENCRVQLAFLAACEKAGHKPHVVFPSSWLVYAPGGPDAVDEDHPVGPLSMYGAHKLCIEHYLQIFARQDRITYTICRISNPYGFDAGKTNSRYKILNSFIQLALAKKPIRLFGDGRQLRDFIYIDDLIEIFSRCGTCSAARNQIFNVSSGHSYSLLQAVEKIMRLLGPSPVLFEPWPDEYRAVEPGDYVADIARATRLLDFRPAYDLESGLLQTAREYRNENKILVHSSGG